MKSKLFIFLFLLVTHWGMAQNAHFWDGIETFDGPTDNNPLLASQLDFYFDKMVAPLPDSITLEINRLIERSEYNTELRDFILWHLLEKYQHPEYMSQDQVFVYLYDHFFSQLEIKDLDERNLSMIRKKAERLRRLALFNTAPNIKLNDSIDLQSIENEFTVLFFYDHDCDLCHEEMLDLDSVAQQHNNITILAIDLNLGSSGEFENRPQGNEDSESTIQTFQVTNPTELNGIYDAYDIETTPLLYILDRDKRIVAKKIRARQVNFFIE